MSAIVKTAITEETAKLVRFAPAPTGDLGFGSDLVCVDDFTDNFDELDPSGVLGMAQDAYHHVTTDRETVPDAPDFGLDMTRYLNTPTTADGLRAAAGEMKNELEKDDRFDSVSVTITQESILFFTVRIVIAPKDPLLDTFTLIVAVVNGQAHLEAIQ